MKHSLLFVLLGTLVLAGTGRGQVPEKISYQGLLTASSGAPVNGTFNLKFELFNVPSGGTALWTETDTNVAVSHGTFSVELGSITPLGGVNFNQQLYMQVTRGTDPPFSPRSAFTSAPSALAPWAQNGNDVYYTGGRVGIGTAAPASRLNVVEPSPFVPAMRIQNTSDSGWSAMDFYNRTGGLVGYVGYGNASVPNYPDKVYLGGVNKDIVLDPGAGKVGIGTINPTSRLEIAAQDGLAITGYQPYLTLRDANAGNSRAVIQSVGGGMSLLGEHYLDGSVPGSYLSMDLNGDVGIRTLPQAYYSLHVAPSGGFYTAYMEGPIPDGFALYADNLASANYSGQTNTAIEAVAENAPNNIAIHGIASGGNFTNAAGYFEGDLYYSGNLIHGSDAKFKENIRSYSGALSQVMKLVPRTFNYKSGPEYNRFSFAGGRHYGFVAQEVEKVLPDLVVNAIQPPRRDATGKPEGSPVEFKALNTTELIPILVQAVQEQEKLIEHLQETVARLEKK